MHIEDELKISKADIEDLQEILNLQYLAYQSEAALFGSRDIPPLKQRERLHCDALPFHLGWRNRLRNENRSGKSSSAMLFVTNR